MVDWTNIIIAAIGTGGLTGLFLIAERKTSAALKNMQVMFDNLQGLYDKLQSRYDVETDKVGKLYDQISEKNERLDAANTKAATSELKRCDCITCQKRVPPLSDQWRMDIGGNLTEKEEEQ